MIQSGAIIDINNRVVHLESGETLPVTHWFDGDGFDCTPNESCALVCGPDRNDMWLSLEVFAGEAALTLN